MASTASNNGGSSRNGDGVDMRGDYTQYVFGKRIVDDRNKKTAAFKPAHKSSPLKDCTLDAQGKQAVPVKKFVSRSEFTTNVPTTIGKESPAVSFGPRKGKVPNEADKRAEYLRGTKGVLGEFTTPAYSSFNVANPDKPSASFRPPLKHQIQKQRATTPPPGAMGKSSNYLALKDSAVANPNQDACGEYTTAVPTTIGKGTPMISFGPKSNNSSRPLDRSKYIVPKDNLKGQLGEYTTPVYSSFDKAAAKQHNTAPPRRTTTTTTNNKRVDPNVRMDLAKGHRFTTNTEFTTPVYSSFSKAANAKEPAARSRQRAYHERPKKTDTWLGVPKSDDQPGPGYYFVP